MVEPNVEKNIDKKTGVFNFKSFFILVVLVLAGLFFYRSFFLQEVPTNYISRPILEDKPLDQRMVMARFLMAINQPSVLEAGEEHYEELKFVYDQMQAYDGQKLSFEDYKDYFKTFNEFLSAEVTNFRAMKTSDALRYKAEILKLYPEFANIESHLKFYWLNLKRKGSIEEDRVPFVLFLKQDGFYFPKVWVEDSLKVMALQKVYWEAIKTNNKLLVKTYLEGSTSDSLLDKKVESILKYYEIDENLLSSNQNMALLGRFMQVKQDLPTVFYENVQNLEEGVSYARFINFLLSEDKSLRVQEIIPERLEEEEQFKVYLQNQNVLTLGQVLNVRNIIDTFGWWGNQLEVVSSEETDSSGTKLQRIKLAYEGIKFEILGTFDVNTNYIYGTLVHIELNTEKYQLNQDEVVGLSREEILARYPFLEEHFYKLKDLAGRSVEYHFNSEDILEKIVLTKSN